MWLTREIEAVADLRFPDALMPVAATYDELLGLIYLCWSADEVEAVAAAYFAEVRLHAVGKAT
jgi:hypothetical protein